MASVPVDDSKEEPDICIIELGGTVGDIESAPFIESMRQLRMRAGNKENFVSMVLGSQSSAADYSIATYPRYIRSSDSRRTKDQISSTGDSRCAKRRIVPRSHRLPV